MTMLQIKTKKRKINRTKAKDMMWGYFCIAPLTIGLLLFLSVPLVYSLFLSVAEYDLFNAPKFIGFENFIRAYTNEDQFWMSLVNAFIASSGVLISMIVTVVLANLLASDKLQGSKVFRILFFLPTICSAVAITIMWQRIFDYQYGMLNNILSIFTDNMTNWLDSKHALPSLIFMGVWSSLGINILLFFSSIKSVPRAYYEAAQLDGANAVQKFFKITLPAISPVSFYILVTGLIGSLQDFTKFQVMTNGNPPSTLMPVLLIFKYSGGDYGSFYGYASCLALNLGLIIAALTGLNFLISRKWVYYES